MSRSEAAAGPVQVGKEGSFKRLMRELAERKQWEADNDRHPLCACHGLTLTRAWREALAEDARRTEAQERAEAEARMADFLPRRLADAGVGATHLNGLRRLDMERPAMVAARTWLKQPLPRRYPFLLLLGPTATGKSQAAVWWLGELLRRYPWNSHATGWGDAVVGRYVRAVQLADAPLNGETDEWLVRVREARFLVLDDLGAERLSDVSMGRLYNLLDYRYSERLPTCFTTNLLVQRSSPGGPPGWSERYDERFTRRIRELAITLRGSRLQHGEEVAHG